MFRRKNKQQGNNQANEKLAKKVLGKDSGRRVFGFPCSPGIIAQLKMLAGQLQVPIFALAEHMLQLSAQLVANMTENPQECELLRQHFIDVHVGARTVEKISTFDQESGKVLEKERLRRLAIAKAAQQLVLKYLNKGYEPEIIDWLIDYGARCKSAVMRGMKIPTDDPPD